MLWSADRVEADDRPVGVEGCGKHAVPGSCLALPVDGVLQIEDDDVGGRGRLAEPVGPVGRAEQQGGPRR